MSEKLQEAARAIVDEIETEREPHPPWSEKAKQKYTGIVLRHLLPLLDTKPAADLAQRGADDLLYRFARHVRNTDEIPPPTWGAQGITLLAKLRALNPTRYDAEVKSGLPVTDAKSKVAKIDHLFYRPEYGECCSWPADMHITGAEESEREAADDRLHVCYKASLLPCERERFEPDDCPTAQPDQSFWCVPCKARAVMMETTPPVPAAEAGETMQCPECGHDFVGDTDTSDCKVRPYSGDPTICGCENAFHEFHYVAAPSVAEGGEKPDPRDVGCLCHLCGLRYKIDFMLSDDAWAQIQAGLPRSVNLLCGTCIVFQLEKRGEFDFFFLTKDSTRATPSPADAELDDMEFSLNWNRLQSGNYRALHERWQPIFDLVRSLREQVVVPPADAEKQAREIALKALEDNRRWWSELPHLLREGNQIVTFHHVTFKAREQTCKKAITNFTTALSSRPVVAPVETEQTSTDDCSGCVPVRAGIEKRCSIHGTAAICRPVQTETPHQCQHCQQSITETAIGNGWVHTKTGLITCRKPGASAHDGVFNAAPTPSEAALNAAREILDAIRARNERSGSSVRLPLPESVAAIISRHVQEK